MGIFGGLSDNAITDEVEQATTEKNVEDDWSLIISICDKAGKTTEDAKSYLKAIIKRLYNPDPHIGVKAVTLLDACVKNSGRTFHVEVASREFENDFMKLMSKAHPTVAKKLRESLKRWAENEFKSDGQLNLIPSLYSKLKSSGLDFTPTETPVKKIAPLSKDPNVVESQEEEDQILKAIELSLKESGSPRATSSTRSTSLYPSVNMASAVASNPPPSKEPRKVRALYDFEAAEDNELTFNSGEIIFVTDDSDTNWWKGSNQRGEGLFPANFVTADLSVEPEKLLYEKAAKKMVQFKETTETKEVKGELEEVEINEGKIDRLLHLLHEADPTNPEKDTEEMLNLERDVNAMGPLIDTELERVDRKHAQLTQLSADLVEALSLYHTLMREPQFQPINKLPYGFPPTSTHIPFNGTLPPHAMLHMMGSHPNMPPSPHDRPPFIPPQSVSFQTLPGQMPQMGSVHLQQGMEERRQEGQPRQPPPGIINYPMPGMPNFGHPGMIQHQFSPSGPVSQTNQNGLPGPQGPHFVPSSTHITHIGPEK